MQQQVETNFPETRAIAAEISEKLSTIDILNYEPVEFESVALLASSGHRINVLTFEKI